MKSKIVVDSSANLYAMEGIDFASVPLKIITAEEEYVDEPGLDAVGMARTLASYKGKTSTSCPSVGDWLAAFEGADEIYAITITGTLSGSCNAARMAKEEYEDANPQAKVLVVDSLSAGPEMELIARRIQKMVDAGSTFEEICDAMEIYTQHSHLLFSLESLNNLARNGRVKPSVAAIAKVLGIRVIGQASEAGELDVICKTRGEHGALERIVLEMKNHGYAGGVVQIAHCDNEAAAKRLKKMIQAVFAGSKPEIVPCGGLCSFYAEHGGLMIGYEDGEVPAL